MPAQPPADSPFSAFAACPVRLLIIGGNALIAYGSERLTQDCDCAVVATGERELAATLSKAGYIFSERFDSFSRYVHLGRVKPTVDVMLLDESTFEKLWIESREVSLDGQQLRVPKPLHLVALKLHALKQNPDRMGKDWEDIKFLLGSTRGEWTREELSTLAERYASEEIHALLRKSNYL
jgi:hypothetical protein